MTEKQVELIIDQKRKWYLDEIYECEWENLTAEEQTSINDILQNHKTVLLSGGIKKR